MSIRGLSLRNSATVVLFSFCLLTPAARSAAAPPDGGASDPYTAILAEQAIAPDLPAIVKYLGSLPPSDDNRRHIAQLVAQLGHDDFGRRELATRQLVALPVVPVELLRAAADNVDEPTELRLRARSVIAQRAAGNASSTVAVACFRTIARRKLTGATAPILDVVPLYGQEFVLAAARDALKTTSRTQDIPLLRRAVLAEGPTDVRVAAAVALAAVAGDAARADLLALAADDWDARVRLTAARALADRGDRACLPPLVDLLWADEVRVRGGAIATLRASPAGRPTTPLGSTPPASPPPSTPGKVGSPPITPAPRPSSTPSAPAKTSSAAPSCASTPRTRSSSSTPPAGRSSPSPSPTAAPGPARACPMAAASSPSTPPTRSSSTAPTARNARASPSPAGP